MMPEAKDFVTEIDHVFQTYTQDLEVSCREIDHLLAENDRLRQLCASAQDEVARYEKVCSDWRDFGEHASKILTEELNLYKYRLTELEARQADLFEENLRLQRLLSARAEPPVIPEQEETVGVTTSGQQVQCWNCGVLMMVTQQQRGMMMGEDGGQEREPDNPLLPQIERKSSRLAKLRESLRLKPRKSRPTSAMVASPAGTPTSPSLDKGRPSWPRPFHRSNSLPSLSKKWTPPKIPSFLNASDPWSPPDDAPPTRADPSDYAPARPVVYAPTIDADRTPTREEAAPLISAEGVVWSGYQQNVGMNPRQPSFPKNHVPNPRGDFSMTSSYGGRFGGQNFEPTHGQKPAISSANQENSPLVRSDPLYTQQPRVEQRGQPIWGLATARKERTSLYTPEPVANRAPLRPANLSIDLTVKKDPLYGQAGDSDDTSSNYSFGGKGGIPNPNQPQTVVRSRDIPVTPDPLYGPKADVTTANPDGLVVSPDPLYGPGSKDPPTFRNPLYGAASKDPTSFPSGGTLYGASSKDAASFLGSRQPVTSSYQPIDTPSPVIVHMWNTSPSRESRGNESGSSSVNMSARTNTSSVHTVV